MENGRLQDPVHSKGFVANCDMELKRTMTFQTIVLECLSMKEYYEEMFKGEPARLAPWQGQGIFTLDFLGVMISCAPHQEMMRLAALLPSYHFYDQMNYFSSWAHTRVEKVLHM